MILQGSVENKYQVQKCIDKKVQSNKKGVFQRFLMKLIVNQVFNVMCVAAIQIAQ